MTTFLTQTSISKELRDYTMITIAMLSYTIGWGVFLLPNNITTGGMAGVSSILFWATGIPVQVSYSIINGLLLLVALKLLGWRFCVKTIFAVTVLTVSIGIVTSHYHAHLLSDQPFMAAIINKYRDVSLGRVILVCDVIIITSSYLVLHDWEKVIYGYVVLYVTAFCIDQVVESARRSVQFFIISDKYHEIGERINREPHRGCTVVDAQGFYSGKDVKMLFVLAKRRQSNLIFRIINEVDPHAFVSQSAVIGVYGEGFDHFKVRMKKAKTNNEID